MPGVGEMTFLIKNIDAVISGQTDAMNEALIEAGCNDDYEYQMHKTALARALIETTL